MARSTPRPVLMVMLGVLAYAGGAGTTAWAQARGSAGRVAVPRPPVPTAPVTPSFRRPLYLFRPVVPVGVSAGFRLFGPSLNVPFGLGTGLRSYWGPSCGVYGSWGAGCTPWVPYYLIYDGGGRGDLVQLYLKDGTVYSVTDYWLVDGELHFTTLEDGGVNAVEHTIDFNQLDVQQTINVNEQRGFRFVLRNEPIEQYLRDHPGGGDLPAPKQ